MNRMGVCMEPGCFELTSYRGRCPTHSRQRERATHPNKAIYNSRRWRMLRRKRLFLNPLCECGQIATDVDHITPIERGGEPYSLDNVQSLCHPCHSRKTRAEQGVTDGR